MRYLYTFWLFICVVTISISQEEYNLSGYVTDNQTGELLIGANIYSTPSKQGTASNTYGYFSVNIPEGKTVFTCSYMGYITDSLTIIISSDSI